MEKSDLILEGVDKTALPLIFVQPTSIQMVVFLFVKEKSMAFDMLRQLFEGVHLEGDNLVKLLDALDDPNSSELREKLFELARTVRERYYAEDVYMRGLIEFTNYCKQSCAYCGIRSGNKQVDRYRLTDEQILDCCREGYRLGYRTFVLQGGEDAYYTDERVIELVARIKSSYPDAAVTLSLGERSYESYKALKEAGVDRYLLRHETASREVYESIHPNMSYDNRQQCLKNLKELGFQVGAGFMVGLPGQTNTHLAQDLIFLRELNPHMIGIGPFIPHEDTPLGHEKGGTVEKTLVMVALTRLVVPHALLPSTTALGTLDPQGREKALKAGANVVMPNLSPTSVREKYELYKDKICTGDEAAHCRSCIEGRINSTGYRVNMSRGDHYEWRA